MPMIRRGTQVPARRLLLACGILAMVSTAHPVGAADESFVDVHTLPRLDGSVEDTSHPDTYRVIYTVPAAPAAASDATKKLLSADGWVPYVLPLDEKSANFRQTMKTTADDAVMDLDVRTSFFDERMRASIAG